MNRTVSSVLRVVACAVVLVLCFVLESSLSIRISLFGAHFDLLPPLIAAISVCLGCPAGLVCGALGGMLHDASGTSVEGLMPLYYMLWGIAGGMVGERYRVRQLNTIVLLSVGMTVLLSLIRYLFYFQFVTESGLLVFVKGMILQAVLTAVLCPLVYWAVRHITGIGPQRLKKKEPRYRRRGGDGQA